MTPWLQDADVTLYHGDVLAVLSELPAESVDCVVTSPPYWGLRDYGTGEWEGGDAECDHARPTSTYNDSFNERWGHGGGQKKQERKNDAQFSQTCSKCGATRIDQQLGLEPTPEQYVERMVEVFREVRRVLAAHGTVWLNLGDSYAQSGVTFGPTSEHEEAKQRKLDKGYEGHGGWEGRASRASGTAERAGLKAKDLVGIPWRVAFALQADGWYLRSDIIWSKPNPMPESVTDRPTKAHEYVFLLSKQPRYFFDQEAVREDALYGRKGWADAAGTLRRAGGDPERSQNGDATWKGCDPSAGRNIRSVWEIATQPYPEAHFATFPEELARRCIAAGCPETGVVLDPFVGSGTVPYVARKLGRHAVGIDLSESYLELAARRLQQQSLFAGAV